ncbi:hypothetical protein ACNQ2K_00240 [Mycoplasma sp. VS292A]|uniref:hypothetical protein n=1 Tax=Mycoplasma sp. VS292A TaxID=3401680 RepID=UPI003AADC45D
MKLIQTLEHKLGLSSQELQEKLGLNDKSTLIDTLQALDIYSVFETKEDLENYISKTLSNKEQRIKELEQKTADFEQVQALANLLEPTQTKLKSVVDSTVSSLNFKGKVDSQKLNFDDLDFSNLSASILKQATELGWEIQEKEEAETANSEPQFISKAWGDGIITN